MKRIIAISFAVIGLSGCVFHKQPMSELQYNNYAKTISGITKCNEKGYIAPDVSARGLSMVQREMVRYQYNQMELQSKISSFEDYEDKKATKAVCNNVAMLIQQNYQNIQNTEQQRLYAQRERLIQQQQQAALEQQRSLNNINNSIQNIGTQQNTYHSVSTTCNNVGNTTYCNSY
ncbi:hypothetical protein ABC733_06700 [Mangrovibacter sp. SLW1]